jgi:hypothetical protein
MKIILPILFAASTAFAGAPNFYPAASIAPMPSCIETNSAHVLLAPSADTDAVGYILWISSGLSLNGRTFFTSNFVGNATNATLSLTNHLPWWIYASSWNSQCYSAPAGPVYWDGVIWIDVTNYFTVTGTSHLSTSPDLRNWTATGTNLLLSTNPPGNCFFRGDDGNPVTLIWKRTSIATNAP